MFELTVALQKLTRLPILTTAKKKDLLNIKNYNHAKDKNKALEQRLLESIKKLPNHVIKPTCAYDDAFSEQIIELSETEKSNFKNLINEI